VDSAEKLLTMLHGILYTTQQRATERYNSHVESCITEISKDNRSCSLKLADLRVGPQSSSAHLQDGLLVLGVLQIGAPAVRVAALAAVPGQGRQVEPTQVLTSGAQKLK
jgi:hypothetical protein